MAVMLSKDSIIAAWKEKGLRITPQRVLVVELLFELPHPTADQIYRIVAAKFPSVSPTTIYSTLKLLKAIGVVRELSNGSKSSTFELARTDHWHFNCKLCGTIFDVEPDRLAALMEAGSKQGAFQVDSCRVEYYGLCAKCKG